MTYHFYSTIKIRFYLPYHAQLILHNIVVAIKMYVSSTGYESIMLLGMDYCYWIITYTDYFSSLHTNHETVCSMGDRELLITRGDLELLSHTTNLSLLNNSACRARNVIEYGQTLEPKVLLVL